MQVNLEENNGISIFNVVGDIDINSAPEIKKRFDKDITRDKNMVLINLKEVDYVDSSGLATLVEVLKNVRACDGKLKLASLSMKFKELFEITKLDKLFDINDNVEEALKTF